MSKPMMFETQYSEFAQSANDGFVDSSSCPAASASGPTLTDVQRVPPESWWSGAVVWSSEYMLQSLFAITNSLFLENQLSTGSADSR